MGNGGKMLEKQIEKRLVSKVKLMGVIRLKSGFFEDLKHQGAGIVRSLHKSLYRTF